MDVTLPRTVAEHNSSSEHPHTSHADPDEAEQHQLAWLLLEFMRAFGLHRPDLGLPSAHVSFSEALALAELVRAPAALSQRQLAERLRLEKSTVSRLTASLQQRGLVTRARDPANRRWSKVALTPLGQTTATQLIARFHRRHQRLFAAMRPTDRQALATGLSALVRAAAADAGTHASAGKADQPREGA